MKTSRTALFSAAAATLLLPVLLVPGVASATPKNSSPTVSVLASGLQGTLGGTIGPDRALYVPEAITGEITRVDLKTGATSTFATGLPVRMSEDGGGIMDVAFVGRTAYALVSLVDEHAFGGTSISGIYRIDDSDSSTVIADIGLWSFENPPETDFFVGSGVHYAMQPVRGGFLVSDGHHNRVLFVSMDGEISEAMTFDNVVPTGLAVSGRTAYVSEAGPKPHDPADGKVVSFPLRSESPTVSTVASGYSLLVDVEFSRCGGLYALSQGDSAGPDVPEGSPGLHDSGELLKVNHDGTLSVVAGALDWPTSVDFVKRTAYVVTLDGEVLKIENAVGKRDCGGHGHR